ncbi:MAG: 4-hydroxybenzoate octaprenyltransferase [Solibacterales bacterium]|nr:4-hydroxybenzoate octaprenyltransferase [Bryobacterales bacterium]|tara:strand:- start:21479 stop:22360 length:882 start_codon:yes stop_codon:yes gene_type:complete
MAFFRKIKVVLEMIKFEHSVFALPFALTGALLALQNNSLGFSQTWAKIGWITLAMVSARSAAMTLNRVIDADIDSRNPRTRMRAIPTKVLSRSFAWGFTVFCSAVFVISTAMLNSLCLKLAPLALVIVFGYSYTKRFTVLSHLVLGLAIGIAPTAAWIAIRGTLDTVILILTAAVMFWVAGFDIIYSCQDREFDTTENLYSLPRALGVSSALWVSRLLHFLMVGLLEALALIFQLGVLSHVGIVVIAVLLIYEHSLVRPNDLSRVNVAFFTVNGFIGVLFSLFWGVDIIWMSP